MKDVEDYFKFINQALQNQTNRATSSTAVSLEAHVEEASGNRYMAFK